LRGKGVRKRGLSVDESILKALSLVFNFPVSFAVLTATGLFVCTIYSNLLSAHYAQYRPLHLSLNTRSATGTVRVSLIAPFLRTSDTMKIDRRRTSLVLLLLATVAASRQTSSSPGRLAPRDPAENGDSRKGPLGTEHAPVDGKDGMPHEGPWIETETDRKNQKSAGVDEEEAVYTSDKTRPANEMPQSNDGVMDDPNRKAPDERNRGTDGGVSQRTKGGKAHGKEPEQPKEAPPLPHSEKERLALASDDKDDSLDETNTETKKAQNFEVSASHGTNGSELKPFRLLQICQAGLTTFRILRTHLLQKTQL
jgi:hypothetical protein